ncbi:MAG: pyridoxamine 5'-phosphate oxidase family protein [Candidatus Thorarchaeota archaeon]|jgi:hypothetical protein
MSSKSWRELDRLPDDVFAVWKKKNGALNPSSVIATIDQDGSPRTAPYGSIRAISPHLLRFIVRLDHDTLSNLKRKPRVMVTMICPPNLSVGVQGKARVVQEPFSADNRYALVEIDIEKVKNDMPDWLGIDSGINIAPSEPFLEWWNTVWKSLD